MKRILIYSLIAGVISALTAPIPGTSLLLTALEVYMIVHISKVHEARLGLKEIGYSAVALYGLSTILKDAALEITGRKALRNGRKVGYGISKTGFQGTSVSGVPISLISFYQQVPDVWQSCRLFEEVAEVLALQMSRDLLQGSQMFARPIGGRNHHDEDMDVFAIDRSEVHTIA